MKRFLIFILALGGLMIILWVLFPKDIENAVNLSFGPPVVGIQPLGSISDREVDSVQAAVSEMYGFETVILDTKPMPEMAYTTIRYPRYRTDSLLVWLDLTKPDSVSIILGLTNKDISITKYKPGTKEIKDPEWMYKDFGIFGLGRVGGEVCVVSSNRLHKSVSDKKFYTRLTRIACHEVGHVLGLRHCPKENCLMNDANESIKTIDQSTGVLCDDCKTDI